MRFTQTIIVVVILWVSEATKVTLSNYHQLINGIKNFISDGSKQLFNATKGYAYIKSVKILLPITWNNYPNVELTDEYIYEDGMIVVNSPNPLYLDTPYTLQLGIKNFFRDISSRVVSGETKTAIVECRAPPTAMPVQRQ